MLTPRMVNREESESGKIRNKFSSQTSVPTTLSVLNWDSMYWSVKGSFKVYYFPIALNIFNLSLVCTLIHLSLFLAITVCIRFDVVKEPITTETNTITVKTFRFIISYFISSYKSNIQ